MWDAKGKTTITSGYFCWIVCAPKQTEMRHDERPFGKNRIRETEKRSTRSQSLNTPFWKRL
jgi:hypothetical protein